MPRQRAFNPVRPAPGIERTYRDKLLAMIEDMHRSIKYWMCVAYRNNEPKLRAEFAEDASPAAILRNVIRRLSRRWLKQFDAMAPKLARYFAKTVSQRSDAALRSILKRGGLTVQLNMTPAMNDVKQAVVHENVALIKSIPRQYLLQVEGIVMRSVQTGRDLEQLTKDLQKQFGVTKKRAVFIARDQNNKATAALQRARQVELGIREAIWVHSGGGKVPRPAHVKAGRDKVRYNVAEGWYDPHERKFILPGELPNCRCVSRPVVPGFV